MDVYDIAGACERVRDHAEALTNWYVRRSRDRFWAGDADAIDTLHTVLEVTCRVAAPLLPLTTERIWQGLTGGRSVHLTDWPGRPTSSSPHDDALVAAMDRVRAGGLGGAVAAQGPRACGCGCRWPRSPWPRPTRPRWRRSPTSCATR